jgi:cell division protein FtsZ
MTNKEPTNMIDNMPDNNNNTENKKPSILDFGDPEKQNSIIKVIGVGGGGGNAVNHMYREGIHDVSFVLCNTDAQALNDSPVPVHLQLGKEGLGAGNRPARAREAALESMDDIRRMLSDGTKMTFITAGMGGGTGTGAAPIIAQVSKEMDILTVGIVTIPFRFEGPKKIDQALDGVEEMAKHVDALLVINNERLREIYPDLTLIDAFGKADDTLSVAAKSIAEIITLHGLINLDFNDVKTVLKDGGVAIMSTGFGEGDGRVRKAIEDALNSPLLNDNNVFNSKKILLSINFCDEKHEKQGLMMEEMNDVNDFMAKFGDDFEIKWGVAIDPELGEKVKVTILATGFGVEDVEPADRRGRHTQEEANRIAEEEEKAAERQERRNRYYGNDSNTTQYKRRPHIFLFSRDDLDNEDVIMAVDNSPTYKRTRQMLDDIRNLATNNNTKSDTNQPQDTVQGVISFI